MRGNQRDLSIALYRIEGRVRGREGSTDVDVWEVRVLGIAT